MKKYFTEFLGAFFLVLTIGLAVASGSPFAALAIGAGLMILVYMGGHISGAHYNPAVTVAVWVRKGIGATNAIAYMIAQLVGAILAAWMVDVLAGQRFMVHPGWNEVGVQEFSNVQVLLAEMLWTFLLSYVVLNVATHPKTKDNSYYGLAIGFTVFVGAATLGSLSGGAFNPAVGLGPNLVAMIHGTSTPWIWLYIVGPFSGGIIAGLVYRIVNGEEGLSEQ